MEEAASGEERKDAQIGKWRHWQQDDEERRETKDETTTKKKVLLFFLSGQAIDAHDPLITAGPDSPHLSN